MRRAQASFGASHKPAFGRRSTARILSTSILVNPEDVKLLKVLLDDCEDGETADGTNFPEIGTHRMASVAAAGNGGEIGDGKTTVFSAAKDLDGDGRSDFSPVERRLVYLAKS